MKAKATDADIFLPRSFFRKIFNLLVLVDGPTSLLDLFLGTLHRENIPVASSAEMTCSIVILEIAFVSLS